MAGRARHRHRRWREPGKRKAERIVWLIALGATLLVIAVTLVAGHLRKQRLPAIPASPVATTAAGDDG